MHPFCSHWKERSHTAAPNIMTGKQGGSWSTRHLTTLETEDEFGRDYRDLSILDLEEILGISLSDDQPSTSTNSPAHRAPCPLYVSKLTF